MVFAYDDFKCTRESGTGLLGTWNVPRGQGGGTMTIDDTKFSIISSNDSHSEYNYTNENGFIVCKTGLDAGDGYACYDGQDLYLQVSKLIELTDVALVDEIKNAASSH